MLQLQPVHSHQTLLGSADDCWIEQCLGSEEKCTFQGISSVET